MEWAVIIAIAFFILVGLAIRNAWKVSGGETNVWERFEEDAKREYDQLSLKDKVEAKRKLHEQQQKEGQQRLRDYKEMEKQRAEKVFAPVYKAFLELEKEYGTGRGLQFDVSDSVCKIRTASSNSFLEAYVGGATTGYMIVVKADEPRSIYDNNPKEAIDFVVEWIAINLDRPRPL